MSRHSYRRAKARRKPAPTPLEKAIQDAKRRPKPPTQAQKLLIVETALANPPAIDAPELEVFQPMVRKLAKSLGYLVYHTEDSRGSEPGFKDWIFCRWGEEPIWAELKSESGRVSEDQQVWHDYLLSSEQRAFIWWPKDWTEIVWTLA